MKELETERDMYGMFTSRRLDLSFRNKIVTQYEIRAVGSRTWNLLHGPDSMSFQLSRRLSAVWTTVAADMLEGVSRLWLD